MKNLFTYLKTLWRAWGNLQSSDVSLDRRSTVVRLSGLEDKLQLNTFVRFAATLVLVLTIGVGNVWGDVTDEITASSLAATGTTYTDFSNVSITSDARYAGQSAKDASGNIQLRSKNSNSGIVSTTSGGKVKSVKITVGSGSNTVDVYGSNTAYTAASDLYDSSKQGTKLGSTSSTGTITVTGDYAYVGIRSNSGAIYLSSVEITWSSSGGSDPAITTTSSMTAFGYNMSTGVPTKQSFTVSGSNLTNNVSVTPPTGYEICLTENGTYQDEAIVLSKGDGTLSATTIYVRLQSGISAGNYSGNIACSSTGATAKNVAVSGSVPFTVTWKANGTTHATTYVAYATSPGTALGSLPDDPDPSDYTCTPKAFYGWYEGDYSHASTAPTCVTTATKITSNKTYNAVFATASGGDPVTISGGDMASSLPSGWSSDGTDGFYSNNGVKFNSTGDYILSGDISSHGLTSVTVKFRAGYNGSEGSVLRIEAIDEEGYEIGGVNFTPTETYNHQNTVNTVVVSASGTIYSVAVEMTEKTSNVGVKYCEVFKGGTTYSAYSTSCAACAADPTEGSAALKGGFSLSSVGVTATGWDAGTNCSWTDYGFVWGTSANPTVSNNKVQVGISGTTTTWDGTLTGPFTVGITYYFRAYGKNGKDGGAVQYSDDVTFTPRQVSFNMHGHGGDAPANQVVNNGGKATDPGDPSEAGWTFGGWYNNDSYTGSAWVFGTNTVSGGNVTLHAKWTEKPKYTITLNAGNGTVSEAGWEKDGDVWKQQQSNGDASITFPSASSNCAGWEFVGWATSAANNVSSDPTSKAAGATLVPASNVTYYAVYRQNATGGTTYNKITSTGDLTTGNYLFVCSANYAMKNTVSSYHMTEESGFISSNSSQTTSNNALVWTIVKFNSQVVIKNGTNYLGVDDDNHICLTAMPHLFTYSYDGSNNRWIFTSASKTDYQLAYSTAHGGNYSYFCVGTSQNTAIYLYKQGSDLTGNYYTSPDCSDISVTGVADPLAGGTVTLSAASGKTGDKVYAMYTLDKAYNFNGWSISGTGSTLSSTTAVVTEITIGSANTTVTASFELKEWQVTWQANGEILMGSDLGDAPTRADTDEDITSMPPTPASCDGTSTTFVGWLPDGEEWSGILDDVSAKHIYSKASDFPAVTGDVTYHAVWAKKTGSSGNETLTCTAGTVVGTTAADKTITMSTTNFTIVNANTYGSQTAVASFSPWRLYEKHTITISGMYMITQVDLEHSETYYGSLSSDNGTLTAATTSGGTTTITDINSTSVEIRNAASAAQARISSIKIYYDNSTYSKYLVKCCNTPTLTFAASPYAVLREDIQGASTTTWAEVDVTFTSNNTTGTISVPDYGSSKSVYKLSAWESRATTGGTLCTTDHAYLEVLDQPNGETPGTGKFHVKTTSGQTGQGTYRIAITQEATDESHGNFCETTVYGFVDVTLRDKFVDNVNGNGTINRNGHGAQLATPTLSEFGTQAEDACHSEGRKLKGWIKETDLKAQYETGSSTRVQTVDGLCETCADGTDQTSLIVAPGANVTMSGATWYAVWAYEK